MCPTPAWTAQCLPGAFGAAIKPIALRTVAQIAKAVNIPVSGIGGIYNWRDAVEFILAGASSLQVCSAVMHHGYRIINDMTAGLLNYMEEMGFETINDFCGKALPNIFRHNDLSRAYKLYSQPDAEKCVGCRAVRGRVRRQRVQRHPLGRKPQGRGGQRKM